MSRRLGLPHAEGLIRKRGQAPFAVMEEWNDGIVE